MLQIAICDDMPEELAHLESLLEEYKKQQELTIELSSFSSGFHFLEDISLNKKFDICFLDIYMPSLTGIETAKELRQLDKETQLVFTTSSTEFALEGYKVQACNYLVKPVGKGDFFLAMDEMLRKSRINREDSMSLSTINGVQILPFSRIAMIEPDKNHTFVHLRNKEKITTLLSFGELRELLVSRDHFYMISRSVVVNFDVVTGTKGDVLLLETGEEILIPRRRKQEITTAFLDYHMKSNTNH